MGLLDIFKGRDKQKELEMKMRRAGRYAIINWSPAANHLGVNQKMIYLFNRGYLQDKFLETPARIEELEDGDTPVVDATGGSEVPPQYIQPSPSETILNRMRIGWV